MSGIDAYMEACYEDDLASERWEHETELDLARQSAQIAHEARARIARMRLSLNEKGR